MKEQIEWAFRFRLSGDSIVPEDIEAIANELFRYATAWAEQRDLGVGGGFDVEETLEGAICSFRFGLTATRDGQVVEESEAEGLMAFVSHVAAIRDCEVEGGFRPYADEERRLGESDGD